MLKFDTCVQSHTHTLTHTLTLPVAPHLGELDGIISEQKTRRAAVALAPEQTYKFLYFNRMNLAQKASFISSVSVGGTLTHTC